MTSKEIRKKFIDFFVKKGHKHLPSSSLIPEDDPSVLLTTAGMQQFKKWFTGIETPKYPRVVTIQKCVRTSDIDEVGDDTHLTFFEMLGNFSFNYPKMKGSYFKKEAIELAWEFLTNKNWLHVDKKRIHATYFDQSKVSTPGHPAHVFDTDEMSQKILKSIKDLEKIEPQGEDNFWTLGTIGSPGGPTVEFYIDNVELWNLVFNEAIWKGDHWHSFGLFGVDTGMGLERLAAVLNQFDNVYNTDELRKIIHIISPRLGETKEGEKIEEYPIVERTRDERIITDHLRAATFLLADGIKPSNLGRGYVLRRLIRRAILKYRSLPGINKKDIFSVIEEIIRIYKNLLVNKKEIINEFKIEEAKVRRIIEMRDKTEGAVYKREKALARRFVNKELSYDKRLFDEANITGDDSTSMALGKMSYYVESTYGYPSSWFLEDFKSDKPGLEKEVKGKIVIVGDELEKGLLEAKKKHQEISRAGAEKKFKGGLVAATKETTKLHTATHLLQQALRQVLGNHVKQAGSNITPERLRFDFTHPERMTEKQVKKVEDLVNQKIEEGLKVESKEMSYNEAIRSGALAVYSKESYPEKVKVYSVSPSTSSGSPFSREICGGPHVKNTSELGKFKVVKEEASSAGIRRIKATLS